ncbi:MAG: LCP family protein [Coriobacteriia bacterium]|nr:LCP family protein [Coriobacteriia bacterium]
MTSPAKARNTASNKGRNSRSSSNQKKPVQLNLVSARSGAFNDASSLSRDLSAGGYAKTRATRRRNKILTATISIVLVAAMLSTGTALAVYFMIIKPKIDENIRTNYQGVVVDFNSQAFEGIFTPPKEPGEPFFMLLIGLDDVDNGEMPRSDTLILCYVDPSLKKVAMISVPRDMRVYIEGWGMSKINAAYAWGEVDHVNYLNGYRREDMNGTALCTSTVAAFAGVDIAYTVEIHFGGLIELVDSLGGVTVDVPMAINDPEAGHERLSPGLQVLNGEQALTFCRSRMFVIGDYQRQANQRTFLQALAKQILSGSPTEIAHAVELITQKIHSNMTTSQIIDLALAFRGIKESDIVTYTVPSYPGAIDEISYMFHYETKWRNLISSVAAGEFPDPMDFDLTIDILGVAPKVSQPEGPTQVNQGILSFEQCSAFTVEVRNGWGIKGAARDVSDSLALAGYQYGGISNTNSFSYRETLIIYDQEADRPAAEDIAMRLGYGRIIPSLGRYTFDGNVLVIVGEDFPYRH